MARPREFDEDAVLDAAAHQFWIYGYKATSVRDLARGMGITGASLFNAFGDKRSLFERALALTLKEASVIGYRDSSEAYHRSMPLRHSSVGSLSDRFATGTVRGLAGGIPRLRSRRTTSIFRRRSQTY